jgi:hypothetical protein
VEITNAEDGDTFAARLAQELDVSEAEVKLMLAQIYDAAPEARGTGITHVGAVLVVGHGGVECL